MRRERNILANSAHTIMARARAGKSKPVNWSGYGLENIICLIRSNLTHRGSEPFFHLSEHAKPFMPRTATGSHPRPSVFSLETLYGPCSGKAKFRRDQLEPQLRGILGEGMEAPLSLLLFVEFSSSIYICHAVPQHVVHQTG